MRTQRRRTPAAQATQQSGLQSVQQARAPAAIARGGRVSLAIPNDVRRSYFGRGRRRYRLPRFKNLKDIAESKTLGIDQAELKELVKTALIRLKKDNRLKSKDSLDTLVDAIFPAPGSIDQAAFEAAVDAADRKVIYMSVLDKFVRRWLNTSAYDKDTEFTPGKAVSGAALTLEDDVRLATTEYFRHGWDAAVEVQFALVKYRKDLLASKDAKFKADLPELKKISRVMSLSLHRQAAGHETVTQLDIVLAESIARVVSDMGGHSASLKLPLTPKDASEINKASDRLIDATLKSYGALLGDSKKDRALTDWLVAHYGKAFY